MRLLGTSQRLAETVQLVAFRSGLTPTACFLQLKAAVGQPDFAALWLEGRLSSVEQAVNLIAPTQPEQDQQTAEKLTGL